MPMFIYIKNILTQKCPRCHEGELFTHKWYNLRNSNKMKPNCVVCGQRTELEPGFYHGTGYVSYALTVGFSIILFVVWFLVTNIGFNNKKIFWLLALNIILLIAIQPWVMRISRILWLSWFFHDDDHFYINKVTVNNNSKKSEVDEI